MHKHGSTHTSSLSYFKFAQMKQNGKTTQTKLEVSVRDIPPPVQFAFIQEYDSKFYFNLYIHIFILINWQFDRLCSFHKLFSNLVNNLMSLKPFGKLVLVYSAYCLAGDALTGLLIRYPMLLATRQCHHLHEGNS